MQSEHSVRNVSMRTVKANEKAGMVSTFSAKIEKGKKKKKHSFQVANTERQNSFKASVFFSAA